MKTILVLALLALFAAPAMADTPTITTVNWLGVSGSQNVATIFGDDAHSLVQFSGYNLVGSLVATDNNDNPYGYGVDSIQNKLSASFGSGEGFGALMSVNVEKDQNYVPMYGAAGASTYSEVYTSNTGYLGLNTKANYAEFGNANYGQSPVPADWQLQATGNTYSLFHSLNDADQTYGATPFNDGALISLAGSGSGKITDMSDSAMGSSFKFGSGQGCYTNANVLATGNGVFNLQAKDNLQLTTSDPHVVGGVIPGDGVPASSQYNLNIVFNGATAGTPFQYNNWAISGQAGIGP